MLVSLLELHGFETCSAEDGESGFALIRSEHPDLSLVDIGLPRLNGFELAKAIRADAATKDLFLVALTGYGQEKDQRQVLEKETEDAR